MLLDIPGRSRDAEVFIGLVGALGTDMNMACRLLEDSLSTVGYTSKVIHLIELLHEITRWNELPHAPEEDRISGHMDAGDDFREAIKSNDALAVLGISAIHQHRLAEKGQNDVPLKRTAYIFRSLKHHHELETLRSVYGRTFYLLAAYTSPEQRRKNLLQRISNSHHDFDQEGHQARAQELLTRDREDSTKEHGQNVAKLYPRADVFIDCEDRDRSRDAIQRFVELVFGNTLLTPTPDEHGMFHAYMSSLRSASLSRQVGALIANNEGDVLAVGTNEVPRAGGGQYWPTDERDGRDFQREEDSSDRMRRRSLGEVLNLLSEANDWFVESRKDMEPDKRVSEAIPILQRSRLMQLLEFGRAVHAEMAAIVDAARRGIPIRGCNLFTTTFPCHLCAKHIVAAGIKRVVYIEPYPKSLAPELHDDSIVVDPTGETIGLVRFESFVGVAPRLCHTIFQMGKRSDEHGSVVPFKHGDASPSHSEWPFTYLITEKKFLDALYQQMQNAGIGLVGGGKQ